MQGTITPKGWSEFQHYKDRKPSWIKLHRDLLDNYDFHCLPIASKALAPCLWLLASEYEGGHIPADFGMISFRLRMTEKDVEQALSALIEKGFFVASKLLADCYQNSILEKETEREKETETEHPITPQGGQPSGKRKRAKKNIEDVMVPDWIPAASWDAFVQHRKDISKPLTAHAAKLAIAELEKLKYSGNNPEAVINQSILSRWAGLFPLKGGNHVKPTGTGNAGRSLSAPERVAAAIAERDARSPAGGRTFEHGSAG